MQAVGKWTWELVDGEESQKFDSPKAMFRQNYFKVCDLLIVEVVVKNLVSETLVVQFVWVLFHEMQEFEGEGKGYEAH